MIKIEFLLVVFIYCDHLVFILICAFLFLLFYFISKKNSKKSHDKKGKLNK